MQFRHPVNGYVVTKTTPWLWTLLFGGCYLLVNGLWTALVIWLVSVIVVFGALGQAGFLILVPVHLVTAAYANTLIARKYLRNGWTEVSSDVNDQEPTRACPFCAEPVLIKAIKCKHCGSSLIAEFQ